MSSFIPFQRSFSTTSIFKSAKTLLRSTQGLPLPTASAALVVSGFLDLSARLPPPEPFLRLNRVLLPRSGPAQFLDKHQTHCVESVLVANGGGVFFDNLEKSKGNPQ